MKKEKNKKGMLDKLCDLLIKLAIFILIIIARLVLGLIWGIWGALEQLYSKISVFILKLPKVARMVLFYGIMGVLIFSILNTREVKEYVGFETIKEQEKIVYVDYQDNKCELDEMSCKIYFVAKGYGLTNKQANIVVAISRWETGNYKYLSKNNFGGNFKNGKLATFLTEEEGINYFVSNLKNGYFDKGLNTIEKIQKVYAPIGTANDADNLNSNWLNGVSKVYKEIEDK